MKENPSGHQMGFEAMEHDNEREAMKSNQSETTPESVAMQWNCVYEMKHEAMDEAYGLAGKKGCDMSESKAHSQFREYHWA